MSKKEHIKLGRVMKHEKSIPFANANSSVKSDFSKQSHNHSRKAAVIMNTENLKLRLLEEYDFDEICTLVYESFAKGTDYSDGAAEEKLVREIKAKQYYIPELSFVAEIGGEAVGMCMLSKFPLEDKYADEFLLLTPVAVDYRYLRCGIGKRMLTLAIEKAKAMEFKGILVEGNPAFYHTVGFRISTDFGIYPSESVHLPAPECLMAMELYENALADVSGCVNYGMYDSLT